MGLIVERFYPAVQTCVRELARKDHAVCLVFNALRVFYAHCSVEAKHSDAEPQIVHRCRLVKRYRTEVLNLTESQRGQLQLAHVLCRGFRLRKEANSP